MVGSLGGTSDGKESNDAESDGEIDRIRKERARADADATKTTIFSGTNNNLRTCQTNFFWLANSSAINQTMQSSIHSQPCNALKNKISIQFENEKSFKTAAAATQRLSASKLENFLHYPFRTTYLGMQSSKSGCKWEIFLATHSESCRIMQ